MNIDFVTLLTVLFIAAPILYLLMQIPANYMMYKIANDYYSQQPTKKNTSWVFLLSMIVTIIVVFMFAPIMLSQYSNYYNVIKYSF